MDERVRGVRIAYDDIGSGPVVVRVHGLTGSRYQDDVTQPFTVGPFVRAGFRVVRYDVRGHGMSDGEPGRGRLRLGEPRPRPARAARRSAHRPGERCRSVDGHGHPASRRCSRTRSVRPPGSELPADRLGWPRAGKTPPALANQPLGPVDIDTSLLSAVLRGAAESDLPSPDAIARIRTPTLVLAWDDDEGHPLSTATALCDLVSGSELHVARTPDELRTWEDLMVDFLTA